MGVTVRMGNEIRIPINVTGEDQAARDLAKVEHAADKAGNALEDMGGQAADAGKASDKAGDGFKSAGGEAGHLQREVDKLTASYKGLVEQLDRTGDSSLKKDIRKERGRLREARNLLKELVPDVSTVASTGGQAAGQAGGLAAKQLAEAFRTGSSALQGAAVPAIVGIAALAAPGIGATVAAAVLGGVGAGGIIGGIALASDDPRVQAAGKALGETLQSEFSDAARPFVNPLVESLGNVGNAKWADKLAPSFDKLADHVEPLTDGLIGLVDNAIPGLNAAVEAADPLLESLATELPELGSSIGYFFDKVAENPEAAQHLLEEFLNTAEGAIEITGDLVDGFSESYEKAYALAEILGVVGGEEIKVKHFSNETRDGLEGVASAAQNAEEELKDLEDAFRRVFGLTLSSREAVRNYEQALDDLRVQARKGNHTLIEQTQAGRDNWESIDRVTKAIEARREAEAAGSVGVEQANRNYEQRLESLRKELLMMGYNKTKVEEYINALKAVPLKAVTEVYVKGIDEAIAKLRTLNQLTLSTGAGAIVGYAVGQAIGHRATGGGVAPNRDYIVGENGPELLSMGTSGGFVHNAGQTRQMLAGASGGGSVSVNVSLKSSGQEVLDALMSYTVQHLQFEVRTTAGGNAQDYFGTIPGG